jgi:hypothetical protein
MKTYAQSMGLLTKEDLNLFREWFDVVMDFNPQYLEAKDYELSKRVHAATGVRWPEYKESELEKLIKREKL